MKVLWFSLILVCFMNPIKGQDQAAAFDFWVGEWDVTWYSSDSILVKGINSVEKILDDKVIQESFSDPSRNFKGKSLSVFDPINKMWHQAWTDNQGGYYNFVGQIDGDQRIFITPEVNTQGNIERMIFLEITEESFTWKWQGKKVDVEEWQDQWVIYYRRK